MMMSDKSKQHVDACRFCWMCHHICPIGNATGQERNTARARALGISLVNRGAISPEEILDNLYECCTCGACVHDCITGWDPVMFTKEARRSAALDGILPDYIMTLVKNCLETGNAYGKTEICPDLKKAMDNHKTPKALLLYLGADATFMAPDQAKKAIEVLEKAGVDFSVMEKEPASGIQLDFLIGATDETGAMMKACAEALSAYETVVVYDPSDAKAIKQLYKEYGVEVSAKVVTYTAFVAELLKKGALKGNKSEKTVTFQDPYQLSRDLEETEEAREIVSAFATLKEMHLNRKETVWAGGTLMATYIPEVMKKVAERRIANVKSAGCDTVVTSCVSEYVSLKNAAKDVTVLSLEDLILG